MAYKQREARGADILWVVSRIDPGGAVRAHRRTHMSLPNNSGQIAVIVGTRPEIVKLAPVIRLLGDNATLIHSRQHEDEELSGVFLAAAGLTQAQSLSGIRGEPRHAQIGRMVWQL